MNKAELKNEAISWPDERQPDEPGFAGRIYGKIKEWGVAAKQAGIIFKDSPELQKQAGKTIIGTAASIAGVKSFYDVPEYFRERFVVRGIMGKGKGLEGSVEDLLAKNWQMREERQLGAEPESDIEQDTDVRQAIADLNGRLKLTKEGGQKGSEQRNMLAKLLKENRVNEKNDQQARKEKITEILDDYTTTKITGIQAARESLNTFLFASGAMALRGVSYGIMDGVERYSRLSKDARVKSKKSGQEEKVNFLKDVVAGSFTETWDELRFKDMSGKKTGLQKGLDFIKAGGKVMRYLGLGYSGLDNPGLNAQAMENLLNTLEGKVSLSDMGKNFAGNLEKTYESYKALPGRVGHLAKAGGGAAVKGMGAVGNFFSAGNAWADNLNENVGETNYAAEPAPGSVIKADANVVKPVGATTVAQPANGQHVEKTSDVQVDVGRPAELERKDIEIGLVKKGKGIEQSLYQQIKAHFNEYKDELKFKGDANNHREINKFAQRQAHLLAEKMGYVDSAGGKEIRVRPADQVAYILERDENGELAVKEYYKNVGGNFELVKRGESINKYEYVHSGKKVADAESVKPKIESKITPAEAGQKELLPVADKSGVEVEDKTAGLVEQLGSRETDPSAEYNLMVNDDWIQKKIGGEPNNDRLWHKAVGLADSRSVKGPADLAESPKAYSLADKYSDEKLLLEILDKNNDYRADEVVIWHQGAVVEKYSGIQIEEMFGKEKMEKTSLKMEQLAQSLMASRLQEFENTAEGKIELSQARKLGIEIFKPGGLLPADTNKLEFIKDRGFKTGISYSEIKARFEIYDSAPEDINLQQIDKYYNAVKGIKDPGASARLIKVWDNPNDDRNLGDLLDRLHLKDQLTDFDKLIAGRRTNGDLVINYITKGFNEKNYMMTFSADGQALLERPDGAPMKFDDISDLKEVLAKPAEMMRGEGGVSVGWFTDHNKEPIEGEDDTGAGGVSVRWFKK
ncbi:MAG: hypothetical protein Q7R92_05085 [bacterium]|nr:hypothetical protein [bacterium]